MLQDTRPGDWIQRALPTREDVAARRPRPILHEPAVSGEDETFLVLPGGLCVPLDDPLHVAELRGEFYVIGHGGWSRCDSREQADQRLDATRPRLDPHRVVSDTLELGD